MHVPFYPYARTVILTFKAGCLRFWRTNRLWMWLKNKYLFSGVRRASCKHNQGIANIDVFLKLRYVTVWIYCFELTNFRIFERQTEIVRAVPYNKKIVKNLKIWKFEEIMMWCDTWHIAQTHSSSRDSSLVLVDFLSGHTHHPLFMP